jgi:hypothetical protein
MRDPPLLDPALLTPMPTDRQQQEADYRQVVLEHRARQTAESTQRKQTTWDLVVLGVAVVLAVVLILSVSRRRYRGNPRSLSEMAGSWFRGGIGSIRKQPPFVHDVSTNANRWTRYMLRVSISLAGVLAFVAVLDLPDAYDRLVRFAVFAAAIALALKVPRKHLIPIVAMGVYFNPFVEVSDSLWDVLDAGTGVYLLYLATQI